MKNLLKCLISIIAVSNCQTLIAEKSTCGTADSKAALISETKGMTLATCE